MTIESLKQDLDAAYEGDDIATLEVGHIYNCKYKDGTIKHYFWTSHKEAVRDEFGNWVEK